MTRYTLVLMSGKLWISFLGEILAGGGREVNFMVYASETLAYMRTKRDAWTSRGRCFLNG